ncbi:hypothetical protein [Mycolicibacterium sediminis]|uniref:Spheroidene monooxygenase n=1 Tax=Mycolicibacterium sediminis TaxID=1286180 RepID=A0A7I7QQB1_9MYCO|nr:hypothetical protein [Mycolicibacterium sediminis]BBY28569.1 hypothetical protein MSEDJ_26650 [Mycolicibacterium sediminis]
MPPPADYLTIDVYDHPPRGPWAWSRSVKSVLRQPIAGLRSVTVNHSNHATHSLSPRSVVQPGRALIAAWDSPESALAAFRGPLAMAVQAPGRFSLDGEVARVRLEQPHHDWHGWNPSAEGSDPMSSDEPLVVVVHAIVKPKHLAGFVRNNVHAASRAAFHPGHRGSVDISSQLPFEHTSLSLWQTVKLARDYAYAPGGHAHAMQHARAAETHRIGCFLQVRPLTCSGTLGLDTDAFPDLPPAVRA